MNLHATGVVLGDRGVLITGPSGSGKSALALELVDRFTRRGAFARLLSDDQVLVSVHAGRLVCRAPRPIAGLVEIRGLGPTPTPYIPAAIVDLIVRLMPAGEAPRLPEPAREIVAGCDLPRLDLPGRDCVAAALAMEAWLGMGMPRALRS
jgi:serine kinase of HPr protein (carbohydrate metabolism regulator)